MPSELNIVAINVGNTRTHIGIFKDGSLDDSSRFANDDLPGVLQCVVAGWNGLAKSPHSAIVCASVNDAVARQLSSMIEDQLSTEVYQIGTDIPVPIGRRLAPETITGVDRLLNAAGAFDTLKQACVIIDAGTAVTVDFVDGEGTFQGGAIAPGSRLQLDALHRHTAVLPEIEFRRPTPEAFGKSTGEAMLQGVFHGIRGMAWRLVEQYAERFGAYPTVVATGGDAPLLFGDDELIDRIVPDLTLLGIGAAARHALAGIPDDDE